MVTSDVIIQAVFATGRIIHEGTGMPVNGAIEITAAEGPVVCTVADDGVFAVSGYLAFLFPDIAAQPYTLNLSIHAVSRQFAKGSADVPITALIPAGSDFDPGAGAPNPLVDLGTILLPADPVTIRGRVVEAQDPDKPINAALVKLLRSGIAIDSTTGNSEGRYRINTINVLPGDELECSAAGFKNEKKACRADFEQLICEQSFRLVFL